MPPPGDAVTHPAPHPVVTVRRRRWAILPMLVALVVAGQGTASAANTRIGVGGATWTPKIVSMTVTPSGWRERYDSVYVFLRLTWSRKTARALQGYEARGLRYTQELNDLRSRMSGTGFWMSDLPGAAFDSDDDDGDGRAEELEITVTEPGAIEPGRVYTIGFQLSRWSRACDTCDWTWNRRATDLWALSQLSSFFFGEWQAERWTSPYASVEIPRMRPPKRPAG
jgi:hypothetical protein